MFSKILIITDYVLLVILVIISFFNSSITEIAIAWIGQVAISSGFYFWKARMENKTKVPMYLIQNMPDEIKSEVDLTQIIISIIEGE